MQYPTKCVTNHLEIITPQLCYEATRIEANMNNFVSIRSTAPVFIAESMKQITCAFTIGSEKKMIHGMISNESFSDDDDILL